jgi:ABC-type polysaccharide/polyol phosphate export permease
MCVTKESLKEILGFFLFISPVSYRVDFIHVKMHDEFQINAIVQRERENPDYLKSSH